MKKIVGLVFFVVLLLFVVNIPDTTFAANNDPKVIQKNLNDAIAKKSWKNSAIYSKQLAVYYDNKKQYKEAVKYYRLSAEYWAKAGHASWGIQNSIRADHIDTVVDLYVETPIPVNKKLEKNEPASGTYLGLFLAGHLEAANPARVKEAYGRNHAIYLTYTKYGEKYKETNSYFPVNFAKRAKQQGAAIQIGYEPFKGMDAVKNDQALRQFAKEANEAGVPVFLRFAGEMNGEWVPWHTTPAKYIEKFRLVHDVMAELAPNVSMVWSPNFLPRDNIDQYYPGDKYVDWVGLSLYTIPYSHGEVKLGGNPIDYLRPIYNKYSHKPMMISEGAISHYSFEQKKDYSTWAKGQLGNMYGFLPKMFPQIKAITYFNLDKSTTSYDNSNNNYDLGDSAVTLSTYKRLIKDDYFIDQLTLDSSRKTVQTNYVPINKLKEAKGVTDVFSYVKLPLGVQPYYVAIYQNNKKLAESYTQPWNMKLDLSKVDVKKPLTIIAFDKNFKRLATQEVKSSFKKVTKLGIFTDVRQGFWAFNEIENAYKVGLVNGYEDGSFKPNKEVSAAEFMTMLARKFGKQDEINKAKYPAGTLNYMKSLNFPHTSVSSKKLTRTEVAEIISSAFGVHYTGDYAIKYLLVNGLAKGNDPKNISVASYKGKNKLTRAQAVKFIDNISKHVKENDIQARPTTKTETVELDKQYAKMFN